MGWNDVGTSSSGSGMWLNLKDYIGKKLQMCIVCDEPLSFLYAYNEAAKKSIRVKPNEMVHGKQVKDGVSVGGVEFRLKHIFTVIIDIGNGPEYKFFEMGDYAAKQLHGLWEAWGQDFSKVDFVFCKMKAGKTKWEPISAIPPKGMKSESDMPDVTTAFKFSTEEEIAEVIPNF